MTAADTSVRATSSPAAVLVPVLILSRILFAAPPAAAAAGDPADAALTSDERTRIVEALEGSFDEVDDLAAPLTAEQLAYQPREGSWSTAQILEHLTLVEQMVRERITGDLLGSTPVPPRSSKLHEATIRMALTNRGARRFTAPPELTPSSDGPLEPLEALERYRRARAETIAWAKTTQEPLRGHLLAHPLLGDVDGYQWLIFLAAHTERHADQIREVMDSGAFPLRGRLTDVDRAFLVEHLGATRRALEDELAGLDHTQLGFVSGAGRWSIDQIAEHLAAAEQLLVGLVRDRVLAQPARPDLIADGHSPVGDRGIVMAMTNRTEQRFEAPPALQPEGASTAVESLALFERRREETIRYVETTTDALREHFWRNEALGLLDGYQWLLLLSAHTARHTEQIREVKAAAGFPTAR